MVFRRIRVGVIVVYRGLVKTGRLYSQIVCPVVTLSAVILPWITFFLSNLKVVTKSELSASSDSYSMTKPRWREHMEWDFKDCFSTREINWIALEKKKKRSNHRSVENALRVLYNVGIFCL